jgi:hypothetical protein
MIKSRLGAYLQCHKNPYATYKVLESFREWYPTSSVVLLSDNGYNYTELAKRFNCTYIHKYTNTPLIYDNCSEIDKGCDGLHMKWVDNIIENLHKVFQLIEEEHILWLEDDVVINGRIDTYSYDISGYSPNQYWESMKHALSLTYPFIDSSACYRFSGHGGSVFHKSSMLRYFKNRPIIHDIASHWREYKLTSNIACDFLLSLIVHLNQGTVGYLPGANDGTRNERDFSILFQHQYKRYYGVAMPHELSHLVKE